MNSNNIPKTTDSQSNYHHSPVNFISHRSKKTKTRGDAMQSKLVKQLKGSASPSPQNFRRLGAQTTSVDNLIQYSNQIKSASTNAYNNKQREQQSKIQQQLGVLVHAQQKDYFGIAQKLYQLASSKQPDLNKKIGVRRAQKLSAALSHQGVDEAIADVIKDASSMEDPANLLRSYLDGKMGDDFDEEELKLGWEKAKLAIPGYQKPPQRVRENMEELDPKLIAQALALKKGDLRTFQKIEQIDDQQNDTFMRSIEDMILEQDQQSNTEQKKGEDEDDVDDSVYGQFWEDLDARAGVVFETEFSQFQRENAGVGSKFLQPNNNRASKNLVQSRRSVNIESRISNQRVASRRSKSPDKRRGLSEDQQSRAFNNISAGGSRDQSKLIISRQRKMFFDHLDKIRKAHQIQINHVKILARDKAREVIYQRLDGVKKVFAQQMAGMIEQYQKMAFNLSKKENQISRVQQVVLKQEKMISEMNIFINSRFFEQMEDIKTAKVDLIKKMKEKQDAMAQGGGLSMAQMNKPIIMNEAFDFYNSYFNLAHAERDKILERNLVKKFKEESKEYHNEMNKFKSENTMLHNVISLMKESDKASQTTIKQLEEIGQNLRKENQRTIEQYEHKIKKLLEDYMSEKQGINQE